VRNFIKLRAAVYELSCSQSDNVESDTAVASADSNKLIYKARQ